MQPNDGVQPGALGQLQITEEDVAESGPRVRALLVARLEEMYEPVRFRLRQERELAIPVDPRMLELGLRICKELSLHYRLYKPPVTKQEDEENDLGPGVDRASLIDAELLELETKLRSQGT